MALSSHTISTQKMYCCNLQLYQILTMLVANLQKTHFTIVLNCICKYNVGLNTSQKIPLQKGLKGKHKLFTLCRLIVQIKSHICNMIIIAYVCSQLSLQCSNNKCYPLVIIQMLLSILKLLQNFQSVVLAQNATLKAAVLQ